MKIYCHAVMILAVMQLSSSAVSVRGPSGYGASAAAPAGAALPATDRVRHRLPLHREGNGAIKAEDVRRATCTGRALPQATS